MAGLYRKIRDSILKGFSDSIVNSMVYYNL